ncbi:Uncharacterised protein [BD1-7 clade bacterium]|uniref:Thioesterase putative domain-containing protein n=1 Tax=BD1-7 clade bacterium TaxID=2029982 RepID=A0A5S9NTT5_9GAMM|nr:Uncharacterised protein [BD1-7 clade bacterium]CAA0094100.1 Uncharacterised protein [BD1-7 clade bacterium]
MTNTLIDRLSEFVNENLPLMVNMGVSVESYDSKELVIQAPLSLNHNDKGTGFGGSLYCLCVMDAIGLAFMKCFEHGIDPDLVVGRAEIEYKAPVNSKNIQARSVSPDDKQWDEFFRDYEEFGKAAISLESHIHENGSVAVTFRGRFAIIGER